jgi:uncharacterized protein YneF (UPF0154 family)
MKKIIYVFAWVVLGVFLSFITHAWIEIKKISNSLKNGEVLQNNFVFGHGYCVLSPWVQIGIILIGLTFGLFCGFFFWNRVYTRKIYKK